MNSTYEGTSKRTEDFLEERYPELFKENIDGTLLLARIYAERAWEAAWAFKQKETDFIRKDYFEHEKQREFLIKNSLIIPHIDKNKHKISLLLEVECSEEEFIHFQEQMVLNGMLKSINKLHSCIKEDESVNIVEFFLNEMISFNKE
jgi:hypothetical protein